MSTIVDFHERTTEFDGGRTSTRLNFHTDRESITTDSSGSIQNAEKKPIQKAIKVERKVIRRLRGFLNGFEGLQGTVTFVTEKDERITYHLPAMHLRKAGIEIKNQPFEMDEFEKLEEDGSFSVGYVFRALANKQDAYVQTLELDEETRRKRDAILKQFAKAND